jgi:hypothetical protein
MEPTSIQSHDEARSRLLEEGIRSYLEAVTALIEFQREVQKKCRTAMEAYLDDYASALKVRLRNSEIRDCAWPAFAKWEGDWWMLGVWIERKNIPGIRWWETSCGLQYESGENGLFCWIGECFPTGKTALDLSCKFQRLNRKVMHQGKEVWIQHKLKVEEATAFEVSLQALSEQWIELWKKVGGIKEAFKRDGARAPDSLES